MSKKRSELVSKDNVVQAILVADTFEDEFVPISNDIPLSFFPIVNKPLIEYTLEFLSLGGVEETFLFCCNHVTEIKAHIKKSIKETVGWSLTMKVHVIVSESCRSFGDCLRDLDAKGLLRGDFVLLEPGVISNISLLPLLKKHSETCQADKGAAMTLVFQESGLGHKSLCPQDEVIIVVNSKNRVLFHKKTYKTAGKKIDFPLEIFLENPSVFLRHNLKDTHVAICSSSVLPLYSDNFDFQTKDDFVRGLLMNEEILGSTVYCTVLKGTDYGGAVQNWRTYQALSLELKNQWICPLIPSTTRSRPGPNDSAISPTSKLSLSASLYRSILGPNVVLGENVKVYDSFIFENCRIEDDSIISLSIIGPDCVIKKGAKVTAGSILGKGVIIKENLFVENALLQATEAKHSEPKDKLGEAAYRLKIEEDEEDLLLDILLARQMSRLHVDDALYDSEYQSDDAFSESEDDLSHTQTPPPDDTKLFFSEVIDSLTRGFEDKLPCENLILEINSSRYAYNVTVKEVNFNVIKAILIMSQSLQAGPQYFSSFAQLLFYFSPVLRNYIKNDSAMDDCLQAVEETADSGLQLKDKWVIFALKYLYEKDYLSEEAIIKWFSSLKNDSKLCTEVKPFVDWLQEAEEESSDDSE
ncbi:translation initiation factor eIF2B subunit epsilon [Euwallacea fornicatus]|uniref:translation initiation factor eIF2B subunit epsilon n=1 Tax=Euwallacea fornicatus TaxID=995702 RepID=UPI00338EBEA4